MKKNSLILLFFFFKIFKRDLINENLFYLFDHLFRFISVIIILLNQID